MDEVPKGYIDKEKRAMAIKEGEDIAANSLSWMHFEALRVHVNQQSEGIRKSKQTSMSR